MDTTLVHDLSRKINEDLERSLGTKMPFVENDERIAILENVFFSVIQYYVIEAYDNIVEEHGPPRSSTGRLALMMIAIDQASARLKEYLKDMDMKRGKP